MLGNTPGKNLTEYAPEYVVFDLETTGISCADDKIIEISAVKAEKEQPIREFSSLINPGIHIPAPATKVNGITDEMVKDAPSIDKILPLFLDFIGDLPLVGHNIHSFDLKFIDRETNALYGKVLSNAHIDTLTLANYCLPKLPRHRLTDLADYYGISAEGAHRALNDCRMNRQIYELLGEQLRQTPLDLPACPKCGSLLVKRKGRFGAFYGCSSYPDCRFTRNI